MGSRHLEAKVLRTQRLPHHERDKRRVVARHEDAVARRELPDVALPEVTEASLFEFLGRRGHRMKGRRTPFDEGTEVTGELEIGHGSLLPDRRRSPAAAA